MTGNWTIIALGANISGDLGTPLATLRHAVAQIDNLAACETKVAPLFITSPVSKTPQDNYLNSVVAARIQLPPATLLRAFKQMERQAGRKAGARNGPRPLDIDLIDCGGRIIGWPPGRHRGRLVLPHPEMHRRAFVLVPLAEIAPHWFHPALQQSVSQMLARLPDHRGSVRRILDPTWISCNSDG